MDCADGVHLEGEMKLLGVSGLAVVLLLSGGPGVWSIGAGNCVAGHAIHFGAGIPVE
jgi:hypothetical protein